MRRQLHPDEPRDLGTWHAVRQYFDGVDDERLWVLFEEDLLPGYAWVFPMPGGGANVGYGVLRAGRTGRELKNLWNDVRERRVLRDVLGPAATPRGNVRAWPIPTAYSPARLTDGPVLYAGDAAAVVDPMTGEGIAQALESGIAAARRGGHGWRCRLGRASVPRPPSTVRSGGTCASRRACSASFRRRAVRVVRSRLRISRTGLGAASVVGCSRDIRVRCC